MIHSRSFFLFRSSPPPPPPSQQRFLFHPPPPETTSLLPSAPPPPSFFHRLCASKIVPIVIVCAILILGAGLILGLAFPVLIGLKRSSSSPSSHPSSSSSSSSPSSYPSSVSSSFPSSHPSSSSSSSLSLYPSSSSSFTSSHPSSSTTPAAPHTDFSSTAAVVVVTPPVPSLTWSTTDIQWSSFQGTTFGACATSPSLLLQFGGLAIVDSAYTVEPTLLSSSTGGKTVSALSNAPNPYFNGGLAYLANGAIVVFAGSNGNGDVCNDILWSPDSGSTWYGYYNEPWAQSQASTPFSPRQGFGYATPPNTNVIVVMGGNANDVWINQDGCQSTNDFVPPVWTQQNAAGPLPANSYGVAMVAMYDANSLTGKVATLIATGGQGGGSNVDSNDVWLSTNYGVSWTGYLHRPWTGRYEHNSVADTDNFLYVIGGLGYPTATFTDAWISTNLGITWTNLAVVNPLPYVQTPCVYFYSLGGGGQQKQLISWGGKGAYDGVYRGVYIGNLTDLP